MVLEKTDVAFRVWSEKKVNYLQETPPGRGLKLPQSKILPKVHLPSVVPAQPQVEVNFAALIIKHTEPKPAKPGGALPGNGIFTGSLRRSIVSIPTKL